MSHEARFRVAASVTILFLAGLVAAGLASRDAGPDPAAATPRTERTTTHSTRVVYRPVSASAELEEHEDD